MRIATSELGLLASFLVTHHINYAIQVSNKEAGRHGDQQD
jgi:hypothetical protein